MADRLGENHHTGNSRIHTTAVSGLLHFQGPYFSETAPVPLG